MVTNDDTGLLVITGGGTGMGRDIALTQAAMGRDVLIVGRRTEPLQAVVDAAGNNARVQAVQADLSRVDEVHRVITSIGERQVIGLVAAAGGNTGPGEATDDALEQLRISWSMAIQANLTTAVLLTEALIPKFIPGRSRIVFIGSTAGLSGTAGPYGTAKAAVHNYARDLARRLGSDGVTVNTVAPGFVADTEFFDFLGNETIVGAMREGAANLTLVGRIGAPQDVTSCVNWLLSADAGWTTGQLISVNGGSILVR